MLHADRSNAIYVQHDYLTIIESFVSIPTVFVWGAPLATKKSSAEKRYAQSEARRLHNKAIKSECRTYARQFVEAVQKKDANLAQEKFRTLVSKLDSARSKGVLTRNAVSRKKSRMAKLYNVSFGAVASAK